MEMNEFYILHSIEGAKREEKGQKERWSRCFFGLFTTYCLLETAKPFLTSVSTTLVP